MQTGFAHLTTYPQSGGLSIYPAPQRPSKLERLGPLEMPLSLLLDLHTVPMVRLFVPFNSISSTYQDTLPSTLV